MNPAEEFCPQNKLWNSAREFCEVEVDCKEKQMKIIPTPRRDFKVDSDDDDDDDD